MHDGILIVDKPEGLTSHDVVNFVRRKFKVKKAGHAGALDPIATGVLVLLLGKATKYSEQLMNGNKVYDVVMRCGITTDTLDATGKVLEVKGIPPIDKDKVKEIFYKFCGEVLQKLPSFSAAKHKGIPLYKLARRGIFVQKEPRKIRIEKIDLIKIDLPDISFRVHCSRGTYVRQLCSDIGEAMGCGAHMAVLRRIKSGEFGIEKAIGFDKLKEMDPEAFEKHVISK